MPANIVNGWTSAGLLPSTQVVANILHGPAPGITSGPAAPAVTPAAAPGAAPGGPQALTDIVNRGANYIPGYSGGLPSQYSNGTGIPGGAPLPSTPAVQPPGFAQNQRIGDQPGSPTGRGIIPLTPEQSYANYLQSLGGAQNSTPLTNFMNITQQWNPSIYDPGVNQVGSPVGFGAQMHPAQASLLSRIAGLPLSPYAMAYGTPAANAPAPAPYWGYATGYGQKTPGWTAPQQGTQAGTGFGF